MDQFTAHLDRGWDLAQRGDASGAEASAKRALELEESSPEAHNLLGYSCALRGEYDDALEFYRQAMALDDSFLEAILNAAELCIHPLGEFDEALRFCEDALQLTESDEETTDALLLKFDAHLGLGQLDDARLACERIPDPPFTSPGHAFLVGRAFFELGDISAAERLLLEAARRDPENPEAHYYLGLLRDEQGDTREATASFLRAHSLDLQSPRPSWSLSRESFQDVVQRALQRLAPHLRTLLDPSEMYVADAPGTEVIVEGADPRAPILLDQLEGTGPSIRLFVYQRNIERVAGALDRLEEEIRSAVEHEVAGAAFGEELASGAESSNLN